jgi:uncharacterized repeat protein (TIGR01451 family)
MRKKEIGQAFIMVLILLGIGALLVVPSLRLTGTSLKSSQVVERQIKGLYAADAAQEYILWKLMYAGFAGEFLNDGDTIDYNFYVCGEVPVAISIVMRAKEGEGGTTLATDDKIKPTKTVVPNTVPDGSSRTYTYTINLEQLSEDTSQGLDAVFDILPDDFEVTDYETGSSTWSVDGGPPQSIPDPSFEVVGGQVRLQWPASYDYETGIGGFSSPMRDFEPRQVKELSFQVTGGLLPNRTYYNWVVLKPWNTVSGYSGVIIVGNGSGAEDGMLFLSKISNPQIIQPGVLTDIEYTIGITNLSGHTQLIQEVTDYLPPGFDYIGLTSGITDLDPQLSLESINDVDRWVLKWTTAEFPNGNAVSIASTETLTLTFWARTTRDVSGSYYNEVTVIPNEVLPQIFLEIGVTRDDFNTNYSWNSGAVIVPAYDTSSDAEGITINSNMALILGGITITSWQVD